MPTPPKQKLKISVSSVIEGVLSNAIWGLALLPALGLLYALFPTKLGPFFLSILNKKINLLLLYMSVGRLLSYLLVAVSFYFLGKHRLFKKSKLNPITKKQIKLLESLSPEEKLILKQFFIYDAPSQKFQKTITLQYLCNNNILSEGFSSSFDSQILTDFFIADWALDYIYKHPSYLG